MGIKASAVEENSVPRDATQKSQNIDIRRYDRGTDAAHLANTPVVSPESKNPAKAGSSIYSDCRFLSLPSGAALPSMNGLSNFLAHFQYQKGNIALFANQHESPYEQKGKLLL